MVIAIDGPAGSGKSTIAKLLADNVTNVDGTPFKYINSGNLYRAVTYKCLQKKVDAADEKQVLSLCNTLHIDYDGSTVIVDGADITSKLHSDDVDRAVSAVSAIVPLRHFVNDIIKNIAKKINVVVEGRDMTSVVFPNAEFRFYLDASPDARAGRRFNQKVSALSLAEIKKSIKERDALDKNKTEGSLKIASGATVIDTSYLTISEVYAKFKDMLLDTASVPVNVN